MQTYFNGTVLQSEIVASVIATIAVILILLLAKKILKVVLTVVVIVVCLIYFGVVSPSQLKDISTVVSEKGQEAITQISSDSDNIRLDTSGELSIQLKIDETWYNINDITGIVKVGNNVQAIIGKKCYEVSDDNVKELLSLFKEK